MIEEAYISFELAELLEEKGFYGQCHKFVEIEDMSNGEKWNKKSQMTLSIPTQQMAMKWLREEKNILLYLYPVIVLPVKDDYTFYWRWDGKKKIHCSPHIGDKHNYESYEEAVEAALKYCLENLL